VGDQQWDVVGTFVGRHKQLGCLINICHSVVLNVKRGAPNEFWRIFGPS
jgi:hypothetical protein